MNNEKIDWHDYIRIKKDAERTGEFIGIQFIDSLFSKFYSKLLKFKLHEE